MSFARAYLDSWIRVSTSVDRDALDRAIDALADARNRDAIVWTMGNGGGSALASHLAIGLTLNTRRSGGRPLRALCLGADAAALSAAINDFGADDALAALVECNARAGDVLCVFSVSGESANVVRAADWASASGMHVVALVGAGDSALARRAHHTIALGSTEPGLAEDVASAVMHAMYCAFMYENATTLPSELSVG